MTAYAVPTDAHVIDQIHHFETVSRDTEVVDRSAKLEAGTFQPKLLKKEHDPDTRALDLASVAGFSDRPCLRQSSTCGTVRSLCVGGGLLS